MLQGKVGGSIIQHNLREQTNNSRTQNQETKHGKIIRKTEYINNWGIMQTTYIQSFPS